LKKLVVKYLYEFVGNDSVGKNDFLGLCTGGKCSLKYNAKDDADRNCCPNEMGQASIYVDFYNEHVGSMKTQIRKMYEKATHKKLDDALIKLLYWKAVKDWAEKNKDTIAEAYRTHAILPGHTFFGYKAAKSEEERWGFSAIVGGGVEGQNKGRVFRDLSKVTHFRHFKICPETKKLIDEYVKIAQINKPYYHWNAGKLRTLSGKKLSNCVVFALDAFRAAGIKINLSNQAEPWDLAQSFTKGNGGSE
jgi:hypothetical protein